MRVRRSSMVNLALLAVCLLAAGCGGNPMSKANYDQIKNGMTTQEVSKLFGFEDVKEVEGQIGVLKGEAHSTSGAVDRVTSYTEDGYIYDTFTTSEMGG